MNAVGPSIISLPKIACSIQNMERFANTEGAGSLQYNTNAPFLQNPRYYEIYTLRSAENLHVALLLGHVTIPSFFNDISSIACKCVQLSNFLPIK